MIELNINPSEFLAHVHHEHTKKTLNYVVCNTKNAGYHPGVHQQEMDQL